MTGTRSLAEIVSAARLELGWTRDHAAEITSLLPEYIEFIEDGQIKRPALESLSVLAIAYGIDMGELMTAAGYLPW
jgi:transcriptional regulator with XRE-family HTH domain